MKKYITLFLVLSFVYCPTFVFATDPVAINPTVPLSIPHYHTTNELRVQRGASEWTGSLKEIESASKIILETHSKLTEEKGSLQDLVSSLQEQIAKQSKINEKMSAEVAFKKKEVVNSSQMQDMQQEVGRTEKAIIQKNREVGLLELKARAIDSRIALVELQLKEADLERKTALIDRKMEGGLSVASIGQDVRELKERLVNTNGQVEYVRGRIEALERSSGVQISQVKAVAQEKQGLVDKLAFLNEEKMNLMKALDALSKDSSAEEVKSYEALVKQKHDLDQRLEVLRVQKVELTQVLDGSGSGVTELGQEIKTLEEQNQFLEGQLGSLRENIAILEYRLNMLERYDGRHEKLKKR